MIKWFGDPPEVRYMRDEALRTRYLAQAQYRFQEKHGAKGSIGRNALFLSLFLVPILVPRGPLWVRIIIAALLWSSASWLYARLNRERLRSCLREVIGESGEACPSCGFDMHGNLGGICSECGCSVSQRKNEDVDTHSAVV